MRIVLLGAPGSGKGTQSQRLMQQEHIPQISTGDLLRAAVAGGTELGRKAREAMDGGRLVADELVLGLIRERLAEPDTSRGFSMPWCSSKSTTVSWCGASPAGVRARTVDGYSTCPPPRLR